MTFDEAIKLIQERLDDKSGIRYDEGILKPYFLGALGVILKSDIVDINDYAGLIKEQTISGLEYSFPTPIKGVLNIIDNTSSVYFQNKDLGYISLMTNQKHLLPKRDEGYFYLIGKKIKIVPPLGDPSNITNDVSVIYIENPSDLSGTSIDLKTIYSDSFLELSIREAVKIALIELDVKS